MFRFRCSCWFVPIIHLDIGLLVWKRFL